MWDMLRKALDCLPCERILVLLVAGGVLHGRTALWGGLMGLSPALLCCEGAQKGRKDK